MKKLLSLFSLAIMLGACSTTPPAEKATSDLLMEQFNASAQSAYAVGAIERAARFYEQALDRSRAIDQRSEIAGHAYNLAACLLILGRPDETRALLRESKNEFQANKMNPSPALLLEAKAARMQGNEKEAQALLEEVIQTASSRSDQAQAYLLQAELACDRADKTEAQLLLKKAGKRARDSDDPGLRASILRIQGKIASLNKKNIEAAVLFDKEAEALQQTGRHREMAQALQRAGDTYFKAELFQDATDRYYRAARSFFAQGDSVDALHAIQKALKANEKTNDEESAKRLADLFQKIQEAVESAKKQ